MTGSKREAPTRIGARQILLRLLQRNSGVQIACQFLLPAGCTTNKRAQIRVSLRQVDPLIRQLTLYRDLIEERTWQDNQEPNE